MVLLSVSYSEIVNLCKNRGGFQSAVLINAVTKVSSIIVFILKGQKLSHAATLYSRASFA